MARPKLKSDEEVLDAARTVLKRIGPLEFTLNDVAKEVGLARATLIQRFTNRDVLLLRMMERETEQLRAHLEAEPLSVGPDGVWELLQRLVTGMGQGYEFSVNILIGWYETQVPGLQRLAATRSGLIREAIDQRLPSSAPPSTAALLQTVLAGACMQWFAEPEGAVTEHVLLRLREALHLLFPRHKAFKDA